VPTGYATAVFTHAFHNSFSSLVGGFEGFAMGSLLDWLGWLVMAMFIIYMIARERALLKRQLREEVASGVVSAGQYEKALSPLTMSTALLTGGPAAARFYRLCGELAHKKEELLNFGDENGNKARVQALRGQLAALSLTLR
jgi:hypothetical protein